MEISGHPVSLTVILGDQLFPLHHLQAYALPPAPVFMAESWDLCTTVRHHKQKILLVLASMRHHRDTLKNAGYDVHYQELQGPADQTTFVEKLHTIVTRTKAQTIRLFRVADAFFAKDLALYCTQMGLALELWETPGFLTTPEIFGTYLKKSRQPKMQSFYPEQRRRLAILLESDGSPVGGKWSFDTENRKKLPKDVCPPDLPPLPHTEHVQALMPQIETWFADHPGTLKGFAWPVTHHAAVSCLDSFLTKRFSEFGPFEDAISVNSDFVFHSALSPAINLGLLTPQTLVERTLAYAQEECLPIQSVEGFLRQVIGWREFIYGISHHLGAKERTSNFFGHTRRLTHAWYAGTTGLLPLDLCIQKAQRLGYVHHIERLMILSNIMLLAEIHPDDAYQWFMEHFVDSAEWVMIPNVYGMGLFADGGIFATKPYIGGSNYILKMSDIPKGPWCDVLDGLYWRFIEKHSAIFSRNPRMSMMVHMLQKIPAERYTAIKAKAEEFIERTTLSRAP